MDSDSIMSDGVADVPTVFVASDHNGNAARAFIVKTFRFRCWPGELVDLGPTEADGKVDYPDLAVRVCEAVLANPGSRGILICGTGTGMCIAANKVKGIRAGIATDRATAALMREHNDCNVLVLGQWRNSLSQMDEMIVEFLETGYAGGRHDVRIRKLSDLDA